MSLLLRLTLLPQITLANLLLRLTVLQRITLASLFTLQKTTGDDTRYMLLQPIRLTRVTSCESKSNNSTTTSSPSKKQLNAFRIAQPALLDDARLGSFAFVHGFAVVDIWPRHTP